jgi:hypothetical protein
LFLVPTSANWLSAERTRAWCRALAIVTAVVVVGYLATSAHGLDATGKPVGTDFVSFWSASRLALSGDPAMAYNLAAHPAAEAALFPVTAAGYVAFFYPPPFLLLCLPLALLPYLPALVVWLAAGFAVLVAGLRKILPQRWALLPILVFPAMVLNAGHGQNGFLTAACFAWNLVLSRRHPFWAGACLGLLVMKPQLLVGAPFGLLAARRWSAIAGAVTSAVILLGLSWIVLGADSWRGFWQVAPLARATLEQGLVEPWKLQSVFAAVRTLQGGVTLATAMQMLVSSAVIFALCRAVWARPGASAEAALIAAASPLCTPFLLDYDLALLAIPLAWMMAQTTGDGWRPFEKIVLLTAYALPALARPMAAACLPIAPLILLSLFAAVVSRAASKQESGSFLKKRTKKLFPALRGSAV